MKLLGITLLSWIVWMTPAKILAEESLDYVRTGFYVGANGVFSIEAFRETNGLTFDDAVGFNVRAGYRLDRLISLEVAIERNHRFDLKSSPQVGIETWGGTLNTKLFPFHGAIQPYLLIGTGFMHARAAGAGLNLSDTGSMYRGGIGLDLYTTHNWVVNLEGSYVFPQGEVEDLDYISLSGGVQYRF